MDTVSKDWDALFVWFTACKATVQILPVCLIDADADLELSCSYINQEAYLKMFEFLVSKHLCPLLLFHLIASRTLSWSHSANKILL